MIPKLNLFPIILSLFLVSCSNPTQGEPPMSEINSPIPTPSQMGQKLPISAIANFPGEQKIKLEVARTPEQKAMGLMSRPALADDRGRCLGR